MSEKLKRFFIATFVLIFPALSPIALSNTVWAEMGTDQQNVYDHGIYLYDSSVTNSDCTGFMVDPGQYDGKNSPVNTQHFIEFWHDTAVHIEIMYGIPWEAVIAQGALESGWGTQNYARTKNAYFGVNAVDSNPDAGYAYSSDVLSWYGQPNPQSYAEFVRDNPRYREHGAFNHVGDPVGYVTALHEAGYATDADYVSKLSDIIDTVTELADEKGWASSSEVANIEPQANNSAADNAAGRNVGKSIEELYELYGICTSTGTGDFLDDSTFVTYSQCNSAWGNNNFGTSTICAGGCGPTALAMAITNFSGNDIDPSVVVPIANNHNVHVDGAGSGHFGLGDLVNHQDAINKWGEFETQNISLANIASINEFLRDGWMVFGAGSGPLPYTSGGHYILIRGVTADGKWKIADGAFYNADNFTYNISKEFEPSSIIGPLSSNSSSVYAVRIKGGV